VTAAPVPHARHLPADPESLLRVRCPRDTDPAHESLHVAMDVRLPLDVRALGAFTKGLRCPCGASGVLILPGAPMVPR
jgi:hypothetical protein